MEVGIVAGGGVALIRCIPILEKMILGNEQVSADPCVDGRYSTLGHNRSRQP
jgi:hypothetical protein